MVKDKREALEILFSTKKELEADFGIKRVGIFGSLMNGSSGDHSNVNILLDIEPLEIDEEQKLADFLSERFGRVVSIEYKSTMNPGKLKRIKGFNFWV